MKLTQLYIIFFCIIFSGLRVSAQDDNKVIIEKYKTENAVITNYTERLVIKEEDGKLISKSYVSWDKLLISDLSPGIYNKEDIYSGYPEKLEGYNAYVSIPSNGGYKKLKDYEVSTTSTERDNVFYDDSKQTEISFTGLVKNSLVHTEYELSHTDLHMLPVFYFQAGVPVVKSTFEVTVPKYVHLKFVVKGEHPEWIKRTTDETKNTITYTFTGDTLPTEKVYEDVPSPRSYTLHIIPYITEYKMPRSDSTVQILDNPDRLYDYVYNDIKDIDTAGDKTLKNTVEQVTKGDTTQLEKAAHIYHWVQKNMHYVAFEDSLGGYVPRAATQVFLRKFGDCKDMTSILVAMCRMAGVDAHFTWIGTRRLPYTFEETPLPIVSNHMICAVKADNNWIFMDGTASIMPFGQNPDGIQGKEAMVAIGPKSYNIIKVPETPAEVSVTRDSTLLLVSGKNISGNTYIDYKGYPAWDLDYIMAYYKNEDREKAVKSIMSRGSNKYLQNHYTFIQDDDENKDAHITADFTVDDYLQCVGNECYVNMNLTRLYEGVHVDEKERTTPLWCNYKEKTKEVVVLTVPKGYHVTYVPPDAEGSIAGNRSYKISYKAAGNMVTLIKEYEWQTLSLPVDKFAENNKMTNELRKQYKESVVLTANQK